MSYIQEENLKYLTQFSYSTTGYSTLDLQMNHYWEWVVELLPMWLAPNLVTLIGLIFMIASYGLMLLFDTTFLEPIPGPVLALCAFCQFMYQTLDAVDGKQARRIKQSSPLGMLLDHGCDSMSTTFFALSIIQGLGLGLGWMSLSLLLLINSCFYLATWEEYHTHMCRTQMFNWGVTETQFTNISLLLATSVVGKDFWDLEVGSTSLKTILFCLNIGMMTFVALNVLFTTFRKTSEPARALLNLTPLIVMDICLLLWFNNDFLKDYGHVILILHGVNFSGVCDRLIISSVARMEYPWIQVEVFVPLVFLLQDWCGILPRLPALSCLCIFLGIQYFTYVTQVVWQISDYLGISVFTIKRRKE